MAGRLDGKVALVTGAGRGIGQAVALKLASEGARMVVNDLEESAALECAEQIRGVGADARICPGSVTESGFAEQFVSAAMEAFGGIDIIVNNAGFTWDSVIQKMTDEQFQAVMDVHLMAPFRILRAASGPIREMAKLEAAEGREVFRKVVNISSVVGLGGNAGQINYSSAKAALVGMTKTLSREWGRYRVNVNCVAFGFIRTRMTQPLHASAPKVDVAGRQIAFGVQPAVIEDLERNQIPLGRLGTPEEAAGGVYLLCIPESNYISGQVLVVAGGLSW